MPGARNLPPLCRICYHYFYESETTTTMAGHFNITIIMIIIHNLTTNTSKS